MHSSDIAHDACPCVAVADNEVGAVSACPQCGVVTLRLQYISLRFETEAFERVASLVLRAQERLAGRGRLGAAYRDAAETAELRDDPSRKPH